MKKTKVAVVGLGHLGSRHLKIYTELNSKAEVVAACDTNTAKGKELAQEYHVPFYSDYRLLPQDIEAVNICVPTISHHEIGKYFLGRGVHTFIEKPITMNVAQADELIGLTKEKNLKLQVGHVERFNSAFLAIKHFTRQPLFIECHRLNKFPNRSLDIGVVLDLMIHDIDIVLGLNDCAVENFHAVGVNVLTNKEDIASVRIIFANGCVCNLTASRVSDEVMRKIRIFLKDAYISLDYVKQEAFIYKKHGPLISKHSLPIEKEEPLRKELESFIDCIQANTPPGVSGWEGREALRLALEITSAITGSIKRILAQPRQSFVP